MKILRLSVFLAVAGSTAATFAQPPVEVPAHGAVSNRPAERWEWGFLSGNGRMGAVWWGAPADETLTISHCRLFLPLGTNEMVPDLGAELPEVRRIVREQGYRDAVRHMMEKARPQGYQGLMFTDPFHPGFEVKLKGPAVGPEGFRDYSRTEDFQTGEVIHRWRDARGGFERRMFVSRPDNVVVLCLRPAAVGGAPAAAEVSFELSVPPIPPADVRAFSQNRGVPRNTPEGAANALIQAEIVTTSQGITVHNTYREKGRGNAGYDAVLRVLAPGGRAESDGARLTIRDAREVLVIMRLEPFKQGDTPPLEAIKSALAALPGDYDALLAPHARTHGELFGRVQLDLGGGADRALTTDDLLARARIDGTMSPALVEKIYDGSRYVILCAAGDRPPNLQGIWSGTWEPAWSGDYTTNTNTQLAVAHLLSSGTPELLQGLFNLLDEFRDDWRTNAKHLYGARGIMAPTRESSHGLMFHWSDRFDGQFWTCGAGWFAHWYWDYWLYTGDREFLAKKAVPWLKEVALFYEDFLFTDERGKYRFSPSNSAENGSGDNSTQDIMVAREVLTNLIAGCQELAIDADRIPKWQDLLAKLPPYVIAPNGELQEWAVPGVPNKNNHRHMSHLHALFQSYEADPAATPELWAASEKAYEARLQTWFRNPENVADQKNNETSSHGRMHLGLSAARLGRGADIWELITRMAGYGAIYPSMATAHYEMGSVFNMDANGGIPEVLNNALVFSLPGRLDLLPALPPALARGELRGLRARGQITVSRLAWSPEAIEVELVSAKDQTVAVRLPRTGEVLEVKLKAGTMTTLRFGLR
jgi:alpha-L-fucosidase 2